MLHYQAAAQHHCQVLLAPTKLQALLDGAVLARMLTDHSSKHKSKASFHLASSNGTNWFSIYAAPRVDDFIGHPTSAQKLTLS